MKNVAIACVVGVLFGVVANFLLDVVLGIETPTRYFVSSALSLLSMVGICVAVDRSSLGRSGR
jgi:hypothetical protein